jgi:hypothetical protein
VEQEETGRQRRVSEFGIFMGRIIMTKACMRALSLPLFALALTVLVSGAALADPPAGANASQKGVESSAKGGDNGHHRCGGNSGNGQGNECGEATPEQREAMKKKMMEKWQNASPEEREAMRRKMHEKWESMTPEEREALRQKRKERWESMTEEQKLAMREKMKERWESMSPEEREAMKNKMKEHSDNGHHRCGGNSGNGVGNECAEGAPGNSGNSNEHAGGHPK